MNRKNPILLLLIISSIFSGCSTSNTADFSDTSTTIAETSEILTTAENTVSDITTEKPKEIPINTDFFKDIQPEIDSLKSVTYEDEACTITCNIPKEWDYSYRTNPDYPECGLELYNNNECFISVTRSKNSSLSFDKEHCSESKLIVSNKNYILYLEENCIQNTIIFPEFNHMYYISLNCEDKYANETKQVLYNCLASLKIQEKSH